MTLGDIITRITGFFSLKPTPAPVATEPAPRGRRLSKDDLRGSTALDFRTVYAPAKPVASGVMAMDEANFAAMFAYAGDCLVEDGLSFPGYAYLAQLTQRPEYRLICETRAEEMTRKWIELQYAGDEDADDEGASEAKLAELTKAMTDFDVRGVFRKAIEVDGFFGRAQIYIDTGATDKPNELKMPMPISKAKIGKGGLKALTVVEPIWSYPLDYNSMDPLSPNFYKPASWTVMAKTTHSDRLLTIVSKPVPDMLKPNYSFGGISLTQMAKPYVDNWIRTRQSVSDLIHTFSKNILLTDMASILSGGSADDLMDRLQLYAEIQDNQGLFAINKDSEDIKNVAVPLTSLDKLQAQAQEQIASVARTPLVKLLGITPSGLNASTDGEIRVYYDSIHAAQEKVFTAPLTTVIKVLQLHLWGAIDDKITFSFLPLWQMTEVEAATVRKTDADADVALVDAGIVSPEESRKRIAHDKDSGYAGLDVDDVPEPPEQDMQPGNDVTGMDAAPRTLYVRRNIVNGAEIIKWAKGQGFKTTLPAPDMHATIAFSRRPVDWMAVGEPMSENIHLCAGGPRLMESFGEARVLLFNCTELSWRHQQIKDIGASWDHAEYQPHITIAYEAPEGFDLSKVEPYRGEIILGPEVFEAVKEDWQKTVKHAA